MKRWPPPFYSHRLFNKLLSELPRDSCSPRLCCFSGWLILKLFGLKVSLRWKWRMPESHHSCASVLSCSVTSDSLWPPGWQPARLLCPWGFSRQEYWSELPCPLPGDLPNPGIKPRSPTFFTSWVTREAQEYWTFSTQELNWSLLHCRWIVYQLSYQGSQRDLLGAIKLAQDCNNK